MRWPEGPPHLALDPPYLFVCLFVLFFCHFSLLLTATKHLFSLKKAFFVYFWASPFVSPEPFFGLSLVQFLFFCFSLLLVFLSSCLSFSLLSFDSFFSFCCLPCF